MVYSCQYQNLTKQFLAEVGGLYAQVTVSMKDCSNASASVETKL